MKIALTGNIGSGKSTVAKEFENLGVPVFYADDEAKKLYQDPEVIDKIVELFGNEILKDGKINFKKLAKIIFSDEWSLKQVNSIIHPLVMNKYNEWHNEKGTAYTILESAIIFENDLFDRFHEVIMVCAPKELRIKRVINRDKVSREDVLKRIENQLDEDIKRQSCVLVIDNDETLFTTPLNEQVEATDNWLVNRIWRNCSKCEDNQVNFYMAGEGVEEYLRCGNSDCEYFNGQVDNYHVCEKFNNDKLERKYKLLKLKHGKTS